MPEIKLIDVNGNERINHDENYQMVELYGEDVSLFMRMDSWDIDVACKLIVFGHTEYINDYIECFRNSFNLIESDRADSYMEVIDWFYKLARSAIAIGILQKYNAPARWLAWAQSKGYKTDHLNPPLQVVVDAGIGTQGNTEPASAKVLKVGSIDMKYSGLLNEPAKKDGWFSVIDDMTKAFHSSWGTMPNEYQAWAHLWETPPENYKISTSTDKGEDCLSMPGAKPLSKSAFTKRWGNYTTK